MRFVAELVDERAIAATSARSQFGQLKSDVCRHCSTQVISFPSIRQAKEASSITTLAEPHKLRPCYPWKMTTAIPGSRAARSGDDINQIERYGAITVGSVGDEDGRINIPKVYSSVWRLLFNMTSYVWRHPPIRLLEYISERANTSPSPGPPEIRMSGGAVGW